MKTPSTTGKSQDCRGCGKALTPESCEPIAGIPYCSFCAPVARSQYQRIRARETQARELEQHERGLLKEQRRHAELSGLHQGILRFEAFGRQGFSYLGGALDFFLWAVSDESPMLLGAFLGFLFADATVWVVKAFFEIPRRRIKPFLELALYMLLFHLWYSSGGATPVDPSARAVTWICFGLVFLVKALPYVIARMHGSGFWDDNPHAPRDDEEA